MPPLETLKYLHDMQQACGHLKDFTADKTLQEYEDDPMLRAAVERQFEIIGEALNQLLKADSSLAESITDSRRIIAFRNLLIHGYSEINNEVVWGVIEGNLLTLIRQIDDLLSQ